MDAATITAAATAATAALAAVGVFLQLRSLRRDRPTAHLERYGPAGEHSYEVRVENHTRDHIQPLRIAVIGGRLSAVAQRADAGGGRAYLGKPENPKAREARCFHGPMAPGTYETDDVPIWFEAPRWPFFILYCEYRRRGRIHRMRVRLSR